MISRIKEVISKAQNVSHKTICLVYYHLCKQGKKKRWLEGIEAHLHLKRFPERLCKQLLTVVRFGERNWGTED